MEFMISIFLQSLLKTCIFPATEVSFDIESLKKLLGKE